MKISVIGLGYVGLPLAVALAKKFSVVGFDIDTDRISELRAGQDRTREVEPEALRKSELTLTANAEKCSGADVYIVTVPTPVDEQNNPDLRAVISATKSVATMLAKGKCATVIYESTVYPGVTEDVCGALLEEHGFVRGQDFKLGYSPERINPGDRVHTVDKITKVIAAEDAESLDQLEEIYGSITSGGVYRASSIKVAEASKAIENAQRDINIAFVNEIAKLSSNVGISVWDVLEASRTKWNFLPFEPGLVGGHCIGVDPYYLSHLSEKVGLHPQVILAGRETNDGMGQWIADRLHDHRGGKPGRTLILGVTFKENVPDIRNSKVMDLASRLEELGHEVHFADAHADPAEVRHEMGRDLVELNGDRFDLVVGAVPHDEYRALDASALRGLLTENGTLADLKAQWRGARSELGGAYWTL